MVKKMLYTKRPLIYIDFIGEIQKINTSELTWHFNVEFVSSLSKDVLAKIESTCPTAIILDSPDQKLELIRSIKEKHPNIQLIVRSDSKNEEELFGLISSGVDFIIPTNSSPRLIFCRIVSAYNSKKNENELIKIENLELNSVSRRVFLNEKPIKLSDLEFRILLLFISNRDRVLKREVILLEVWGRSDITKRTIDTNIVSIRKKLAGFSLEIHSIYGIGYVLRGPEFR